MIAVTTGFAVALLAVAPIVSQKADATFPSRPSEGLFYVDDAGLLSHDAGRAVNAVCESTLREMGVRVMVATIPSLKAQGAGAFTIEWYGAELYRSWAITSLGESKRGALLVVSPGDRRAHIVLSPAWDPSTSPHAQHLLATRILPRLREARFSEGILDGVRGLDALARGVPLPAREPRSAPVTATIALGGVAVAAAVSLWRSGRRGWTWLIVTALQRGVLSMHVAWRRRRIARGRADALMADRAESPEPSNVESVSASVEVAGAGHHSDKRGP